MFQSRVESPDTSGLLQQRKEMSSGLTGLSLDEKREPHAEPSKQSGIRPRSVIYGSDSRYACSDKLKRYKKRNLFSSQLTRIQNQEVDLSSDLLQFHIDTTENNPSKSESVANVLEEAEVWREEFWVAKRKQEIQEERFQEVLSGAVTEWEYQRRSHSSPSIFVEAFAKPSVAARRRSLLEKRRERLKAKEVWSHDKVLKAHSAINKHFLNTCANDKSKDSAQRTMQVGESARVKRVFESEGNETPIDVIQAALFTTELRPSEETQKRLPYQGFLLTKASKPLTTANRKVTKGKKGKTSRKKPKGKKQSKATSKAKSKSRTKVKVKKKK